MAECLFRSEVSSVKQSAAEKASSLEDALQIRDMHDVVGVGH